MVIPYVDAATCNFNTEGFSRSEDRLSDIIVEKKKID